MNRYFLILFILSCNPNDEFLLEVLINPEDAGNTNHLSGLHPRGAKLNISATPNEFYEFDHWSGDYNSKSPNISIEILSNMSIKANFKYLDSDNDGVSDKDDFCPNTDNNMSVNNSGCPYNEGDFDNDGVLDEFDLCPNTPNDTYVNTKGCPLIEIDENGVTLKATHYARDYIGETTLFRGDSFVIVRNWEHLKSYGPSTYKGKKKFITTFIEETRELCSLPCTITQYFEMKTWDLTNVKSMYFTFWNTIGYNQDISNWNTYNVKTMEGVFFHAYDLDVDISKWNVSNVQNMKRLFRGAFTFNPNVSQWDVSNVTNMLEMFHGTDISRDLKLWDVSNVTSMEKMFYNAKKFNQDLSIWDVGNVTDCYSFSENADKWSLPKPSFIKCDTGE